MPDRRGVKSPMTIMQGWEFYRGWEFRYYIWIDDERWAVRRDKAKRRRLMQYPYGIYKEVQRTYAYAAEQGYEWEVQNVAMWKWSARLYLWNVRRRAAKAKRLGKME